MQGPTTATIRSGRAPRLVMDETAACTTPPRAPRQPAWAAATTRASGSASSTGAQSAASEILTQGELLQRLGIEARAATLARVNPDRVARELHRLTAPDQMGVLFKALAIHSPGLSVPGFES